VARAIRQPDIVFMSNEHRDRIAEKYWGVPDLAIEIISESTSKEDRTEKFYEYSKAGILEYWIVDPLEQTIEVFALDKGTYKLLGRWEVGETARSKVLGNFVISVNYIME
jgi:Uma2 family endonuclease